MAPLNDQTSIKVRISIGISPGTGYAQDIHYQQANVVMEDGRMDIPTDEVGETARTMLRNAFDLPVVGGLYDTVVRNIAAKSDGK